MKNVYTVVTVAGTDGRILKAVPADSGRGGRSPLSARRRRAITVSNPLGIPVTAGERIRIEVPEKARALRGIVSLVFPVLCMGAGGYFAPQILSLVQKAPSENARAVCMICCFAAACVPVRLCAGRVSVFARPVLAEVYRESLS